MQKTVHFVEQSDLKEGQQTVMCRKCGRIVTVVDFIVMDRDEWGESTDKCNAVCNH